MPVPERPKIYHIVHVDRLPSIISDGCLWCDSESIRRRSPGSTIGMNRIKERRLNELTLNCYPDLHVGDCVPFYFCPRSIMLYIINLANHPDLDYRGGQGPIIHLEADLHDSVEWANQNGKRWAFTLSNAGSLYFEDRSELRMLNEIDWTAVQALNWQNCKEGKQAEFLMAQSFPWHLVERIGVRSQEIYQQVFNSLAISGHKPQIEIKLEWYY
ncbi:MAG: DUF4433 domain-containing protein [Chloroflexi bacterium]|nr:DUF4433 domain-containing protein [Chloroflexota bacterium]